MYTGRRQRRRRGAWWTWRRGRGRMRRRFLLHLLPRSRSSRPVGLQGTGQHLRAWREWPRRDEWTVRRQPRPTRPPRGDRRYEFLTRVRTTPAVIRAPIPTLGGEPEAKLRYWKSNPHTILLTDRNPPFRFTLRFVLRHCQWHGSACFSTAYSLQPALSGT